MEPKPTTLGVITVTYRNGTLIVVIVVFRLQCCAFWATIDVSLPSVASKSSSLVKFNCGGDLLAEVAK